MAEGEYRVLYRHQERLFLPTHDVPFVEISDDVEGKVLCIEEGE